MPRLLFIVDDDELSREVLALVAQEAGFDTLLFDSGESVLAHLALHRAAPPSAFLVDFQMPGLAGDPLALRLRPACPAGTLLIAMSGSPVAPERRAAFDAFLPKPFNFEQFLTITESVPDHNAPTPDSAPAEIPVLSEPTYRALAQSMPSSQLRGLYAMLLDDADRRLALMRTALLNHDADTWTRAAHAIKGGCGMVGALELAAIASEMEECGLPLETSGSTNPDPFLQFHAAAGRLRSMLDAQP